MKTKKSIIRVSKETKIMDLEIKVRLFKIARSKIKKTNKLNKYGLLKNHLHASKKHQI
jgi:hypothetical protein